MDALATIQGAQRPWANEIGAAVGERNLQQAIVQLDRVLNVLATRRSR
jgi:hypothetical protein